MHKLDSDVYLAFFVHAGSAGIIKRIVEKKKKQSELHLAFVRRVAHWRHECGQCGQ